MGGISDFFTSLSFIYFIGAGATVYSLARGWRSFWDEHLTPRDYQLASGVAVFLLTPLAVLLHEFGHMVAAWSTGGEVLRLGYFLYWGYVSYRPATTDTLAEWYVALAGNAVGVLLGVVCIFVAIRFSNLRIVLRVTLLQLGILGVVGTLIAYPLLDIATNFAGDWEAIYSFQAPVASGITAVLHALSLIGFVLFMRRSQTVKQLLPF